MNIRQVHGNCIFEATKLSTSLQKMIREEDKDAVVYRIIEKLQNSSLFLEMKADLQVERYRIIIKLF